MLRIRSSLVATLGVFILSAALFPQAPFAQDMPADAAATAETEAGDEEVGEPEEQVSPLILQADELGDKIMAALGEMDRLKVEMKKMKGEELLLLENQTDQRATKVLAEFSTFVNLLLEIEKDDTLDGSVYRDEAEKLATGAAPSIRRQITREVKFISEESSKLSSLEGEERQVAEEALQQRNARLDLLLQMQLELVQNMELLGLGTEKEREFLVDELTRRTEIVAGRIDLTLEKIANTQGRLLTDPGNSKFQQDLLLLQEKLQASIVNMRVMIGVMGKLEMDATRYQQLLIRSTGEITGDIFNMKVAAGLFQQYLDDFKSWLVQNGPTVLIRVLIFFLIIGIAKLLSIVVGAMVRRGVKSSKFETSKLLQKMMIGLASRSVMIVGILIALAQLGIKVGPLLAGLGVMGFIVGFALQDNLANFAAGAMILIYRPYDVGDLIEAAGVFGEVNNMSLVSTTILTLDRQTLVVPNNKIWGDVIKNVKAQKRRRVDLLFKVDHSNDVVKVENLLKAIVAEHPMALEDPEPTIKLHNLGEFSMDFVLRIWTTTDDYWEVYWDVIRETKLRFEREGISFPSPPSVVHLRDPRNLESE